MNFYERFFLQIVNMSLTGGFVILGVLPARLLLKRAPKIFSYILWALAGIKLVIPFSIQAVFSLIPVKLRAVDYENIAFDAPAVDTGLAVLDSAVNQTITGYAAPTPYSSVNPMQIYVTLAALLWGSVAAVILIRGIGSYFRLKKKLAAAVLTEKGKVPVYETDRLDVPILLGICRPAIYIPLNLDCGYREYVIAHEKVHVGRKDHLIKLCAYAILALHWFNPLVWAAFYLMTKDMEMSCDEKVMQRQPQDIRVEYSEALLHLAMRQSRLLSLSPLAFGENNTKSRVKNVLKYKKPALWAAIGGAAVICAAALVLLTEKVPGTANPLPENENSQSGGQTAGTAIDGEGEDGSEDWAQALCDRRTPFVGQTAPKGTVAKLLLSLFPENTQILSQEKGLNYNSKVPHIADMSISFAGMDTEGCKWEEMLYKGGAVLLATIENINKCTLSWADEKGKTVIVEVARSELEEVLGISDIYAVSENKESMQKYLASVDAYIGGTEIVFIQSQADIPAQMQQLQEMEEKLEEELEKLEALKQQLMLLEAGDESWTGGAETSAGDYGSILYVLHMQIEKKQAVISSLENRLAELR